MILTVHNPPPIDTVRSAMSPQRDDYAKGAAGGAFNPPYGMDVAWELQSQASLAAGVELVPVNTFAWDWRDGAELTPHIDREGLDWTVSVPLDGMSARWPFHIDGIGPVQCEYGQGILCNGRIRRHWREPLDEPHSTWLLLHYRAAEPQAQVRLGLLSEEEIACILAKDYEWARGTTFTGKHRSSQVSWLRRPQWDWLADRIEGWMRTIEPSLPKKQPESIQLTRYGEGGFYGWHADKGNHNTRVLSATVLLQAADEGGQFEIRDHSPIPLSPGDAVAFRSTRRHCIHPITRGTRFSLVRWLSGR